ncbi:MAG: Omp28-related outer membrane protein [Bacteroidota bacterium]
MKKLVLALACISILFNACKKDDTTPAATGSTTLTVEKKNRAAIIYFGEDWCPPCGSYGGPTLDSCLKQEGSLLTGMKINTSSNNSSLNWATGNGMWTVFNSGVFASANAIPSMAVNTTKQSVTTSVSSNYSGAVAKATTFANSTIIAGVALRKSISGDSISVDTKVKFYSDIVAGSDYRLAVYVVEDKIFTTQSTSAGSVSNYEYRNLVRTCNASAYSGVTINNGGDAITLDQEFSNTYKMYLKPTWNKSNLKVIGILWKMGGSPAQVVNSNVAY